MSLPRSATPITIACVGDSLTAKEGDCNVWDPWTDRLQRLLGSERFRVLNFGHGGAKASSFARLDEYQNALRSNAQLVFVMLGTNDAGHHHWVSDRIFLSDMRRLVLSFKAMPSHPHVVLLVPPPMFKASPASGAALINNRLPGLITSLAKQTGTTSFSIRDVVLRHGLRDADSCDGTHYRNIFHVTVAEALNSYIRSLAQEVPEQRLFRV